MTILTLTVVLAIAAFAAVFRTTVLNDTIPMPIMGTIVATLAATAVIGAGFGASALVTYNTTDLTPVMTHTHQLRALDTGTDTHGVVYLLGGQIESGPSYSYLVERPDGGFEMDAIPTGDAIVYQTDETEPYMVTGQVRPTSILWSLLPMTDKTEFYVPVGSVQDASYRVDVTR